MHLNHHLYEFWAGRIHRASAHSLVFGSIGAVVERLDFFGSHGRTVWVIQITHSHKSGLAEILSLAQMFHKNVCPPVTFPYKCWLLFMFFLHALSSFEIKEVKGKQSCELVWDPEKSQTLQEPGSETDFAQLNLLLSWQHHGLLVFLFSWKMSVSLSDKMKFFGGKLFLCGRTTHSNRKSSTR